MKKNRLIGISDHTKQKLKIQAAEVGLSFKLYCETILEKQAGNITIQTAGAKPLPQPHITEDDISKDIDFKPQLKQKTIKAKITEVLNTSGAFKRVEPYIYTNGHCFEHRRMVVGKGLTKDYYKTLEQAQKAANNGCK